MMYSNTEVNVLVCEVSGRGLNGCRRTTSEGNGQLHWLSVVDKERLANFELLTRVALNLGEFFMVGLCNYKQRR